MIAVSLRNIPDVNLRKSAKSDAQYLAFGKKTEYPENKDVLNLSAETGKSTEGLLTEKAQDEEEKRILEIKDLYESVGMSDFVKELAYRKGVTVVKRGDNYGAHLTYFDRPKFAEKLKKELPHKKVMLNLESIDKLVNLYTISSWIEPHKKQAKEDKIDVGMIGKVYEISEVEPHEYPSPMPEAYMEALVKLKDVETGKELPDKYKMRLFNIVEDKSNELAALFGTDKNNCE